MVMVVVVMMAVMLVEPVVMMMMVMLLRHRSCVGAAGADDRQRDSQGKSQPESRQEGLLHDFVSFSARAEFGRHRARSVPVNPAVMTIASELFDSFSGL